MQHSLFERLDYSRTQGVMSTSSVGMDAGSHCVVTSTEPLMRLSSVGEEHAWVNCRLLLQAKDIHS